MAQQFGIGAGRVLLRCIGELTEENSNERSSPAAEAGLLLIRCVAFGPAADEESFDLLVYRPMFYLICGRVRSIPGHGRDPQRGSSHPNSREHPAELPQVRCRPPRKAGQEAGGAWLFFRWQPDFLGAKTPVSGLCLVHHPLPGEGGAPDLLVRSGVVEIEMLQSMAHGTGTESTAEVASSSDHAWFGLDFVEQSMADGSESKAEVAFSSSWFGQSKAEVASSWFGLDFESKAEVAFGLVFKSKAEVACSCEQCPVLAGHHEAPENFHIVRPAAGISSIDTRAILSAETAGNCRRFGLPGAIASANLSCDIAPALC